MIVPDDQGVLDIAVSYDGTGQKRGHSCHNGIGCAIELLSGLPIDYEVLSNFCLKCKITSEDPSATDERKAAHAENCPRNFTGTANAMEVEAVEIIIIIIISLFRVGLIDSFKLINANH